MGGLLCIAVAWAVAHWQSGFLKYDARNPVPIAGRFPGGGSTAGRLTEERTVHHHHNGLKTAALFGVLWAVLLGVGALMASSMRQFLVRSGSWP